MNHQALHDASSVARRRLITLLTAAIAACSFSSAQAMTRVVETYGSDGNPCTLAAPCQTIGAAIAVAGTNGRVVVGPGNYPEALHIPFRRIQITSRLGAAQTVINTPAGYDAAVNIAADQIVFGQRNKGFTVRIPNGGSGVRGSTSRTRLEGNVIMGWLSFGKRGIVLSGDRNTVRFNDVVGRGYAGETMGIELTAPILSSSTPTGVGQLIQGNRVSGISQCIGVTSFATNHRNRILDNTLNECELGLRVDNWRAGQAGYADRTAGRITNNTVRLGRGSSARFPYGVLTVGGNPAISGVDVDMTGGGFIGVGVFRSSAASIVNSNVVGGPDTNSTGAGMMFSGVGRTTISGNSVTGMPEGFRFSAFATSTPLRKNNVWSIGTCALSFDQVITDTQRFTANFWGESRTPPDTSCDPETDASTKNGALRFSPASVRN